MPDKPKIRNIAIVAHVDHGKTSLVDQLLKQSGTFRNNQEIMERVMDSNELEREKGITIFSKIASIHYNDIKINIVDTPGHSDFSGEVERILMMVDSILLVVDACEGPMPQTKFVLRKSLALDLMTLVVINKIDRQGARINDVINEIGDLYIDLGADDSQLDFPVIYTSARNGTASMHKNEKGSDMRPLFDAIINHAPAPVVDEEAKLQMSINAMDYSDFLGRIGIGRIFSGQIKIGDQVILINQANEHIKHTITKLYTYEGLKRIEISEALAGDIIALAGVPELNIGDTITSVDDPEPLPRIKIEEPTISIEFLVNDSPFYGKEGKYYTSRHLYERLKKETLTDVALKVEGSEDSSTFKVAGRGELHLAILIERMRREGYEFQISKPQVIFKEIHNEKMEPIELLIIEVPENKMGTIIDKINQRKGELREIKKDGDKVQLEFLIPTRGIIGFRTEFMTITKGEGIMYHTFELYKPFKGEIKGRDEGSLIALEEGQVTTYALDSLSDRGVFLVEPGIKVYRGMIVGIHNKSNDLVINICKKKHLSNVRSSTSDESIKLIPPRKFSLEESLEYIETDELMEVTPSHIRLRKKVLDHDQRKAMAKEKQQEMRQE